MSFYNADPRAYFEWYDKKWSDVWDNDNNSWNLTDFEVGRLVRIINTSSGDQSHNYKIYKVEYGTEDPTISSDDEQFPHKYLKEFTFTNPFSLVVGTGVNANSSNINQTVVGKYNANDPDALFIVGTGTDSNTTDNGLVVTSDGAESKTFQSGNNKLTKDGLYLNNASPITLTEIDNEPVLMLGTDPIAKGGISITGTAKYITEATGQKIGEITVTSPQTGASIQQDVKLPTTITQDTTFDNPSNNQKSQVIFNNTVQIGSSAQAAGQLSNLHYGKYTIAFVETMPDEDDIDEDTLYFVLGTGTN